jgi:hypothetical protein
MRSGMLVHIGNSPARAQDVLSSASMIGVVWSLEMFIECRFYTKCYGNSKTGI